ncbi:uncharacterized protein B0H18DRAFT_867006 [Fomitopsis serialis]|uniref:uncharacterized protein n=1 Tax=Fomitopsis serialis TaxID=139415 RepID=UPI002007E685|nr:uncharacterized protein B0H18DRAFT_867006 [Neoantrodia serialis]KAH9937112.1 hypothetical protein B0H18DRAFT_867006 [Neoantrodia serialis]
MCFGENCALQATQYVNAQLAVLHANAMSCFREHENSQKPEEHLRYGHALYDFVYGKVAKRRQTKAGYDTEFHALFDKPVIDFICNHDAILRIKIKSGHYYMDASDQGGMIKKLSDQSFDFRVGFDVRTAASTDLQIGNGPVLIRLITLNLLEATFLSASPPIEYSVDVLLLYLQRYLEFLQKAGNHVLFSLPNFEISRLPLTIDYTASRRDIVMGCTELYGVHVSKINEQLKLTWTKAAVATAIGVSDGVATSDWKANSVAEYRGSWSIYQSDVRFHLKFGPPTVDAICSREAVLNLMLDKVLVFEEVGSEGAPTGAFDGWRIPITVEVFQEQDTETRIRVDLSKAKVISQLPEGEEDGYEDYRMGILDFVRKEYLAVLESAGYLILYDTGRAASFGSVQLAMTRIDSSGFSGSFEESAETTQASWTDIIAGSDMQGFDQVIAVSQKSINSRFSQIHEAAKRSENRMSILSKWSYEQYFSAAFEPLAVHLLSNNRALLWVHLTDGSLRSLVDMEPSLGEDEYEFEDLRLAFEVKLEMLDDATLQATSPDWYSNASASHAYKAHGNQADCAFRYLCFDTIGAEFLYEYSQIDDLLHTTGSELIDKLQGMIYYLRQHYFPALVANGLHILYTTPIWSVPPSTPSYALTDVTFQVYSSVEVTRHNWAQLSVSVEPVLAILGMTSHRPRPGHNLTFSTNWVARAERGFSHGTVAISNKDQSMLHRLARINSLTSVIPVLVAAESADGWQLQLTTIAARHGARMCPWKVETIQENSCIKYEWEYSVSTTYSHEGSGITNGAYAVTCSTRNYVELPTVFRSGKLELKAWGEVTVGIDYKAGSVEGSASGVARWLAPINIQTDLFNGVKSDALDQVPVVCEKVEYRGNAPATNFINIQAELQAQLPQMIDFKEVVQGMRQYEGAWQTCYPGVNAYALANPVFNRQGDLLFELRPLGQWNAAPAPPRLSKASPRSTKDVPQLPMDTQECVSVPMPMECRVCLL